MRYNQPLSFCHWQLKRVPGCWRRWTNQANTNKNIMFLPTWMGLQCDYYDALLFCKAYKTWPSWPHLLLNVSQTYFDSMQLRDGTILQFLKAARQDEKLCGHNTLQVQIHRLTQKWMFPPPPFHVSGPSVSSILSILFLSEKLLTYRQSSQGQW